MLNVKKLLTKILTRQSVVSAPMNALNASFTATCDGIFSKVIRYNGSGAGAFAVTDSNGNTVFSQSCYPWHYYTVTFPVVKGVTYTVAAYDLSTNVTDGVVVPYFNGGGVLLKGILTPCRKAVGVC